MVDVGSLYALSIAVIVLAALTAVVSLAVIGDLVRSGLRPRAARPAVAPARHSKLVTAR